GRYGLVVEVATDGHGRFSGDELLDAGVSAEFGTRLGRADVVLEQPGISGDAVPGFGRIQAGDKGATLLRGNVAAVGPEVGHGGELRSSTDRNPEHVRVSC